MDDIRLFSDYSPEQYFKVWGHLPFWEDFVSYRERDKIAEAKYATK